MPPMERKNTVKKNFFFYEAMSVILSHLCSRVSGPSLPVTGLGCCLPCLFPTSDSSWAGNTSVHTGLAEGEESRNQLQSCECGFVVQEHCCRLSMCNLANWGAASQLFL